MAEATDTAIRRAVDDRDPGSVQYPARIEQNADGELEVSIQTDYPNEPWS